MRNIVITGCCLVLAILLLQPLARFSAAQPKGEKQKEAAQAGWKSLFDGKSLTGWKSAQFGGDGEVKVSKGTLLMEQGDPMTGVAYTRGDFPKMDYEVTLEAQKLKGSDFFCAATFPVGDTFCSLVVGGWGGTIVGLSSINFHDASENETTSFREFKHNQWYRLRIRVSKERIEAWIDGKKMVDVDTKDKKLSIRAECDSCKPFGLATYRTTGAIRDLRLRRLTEADKKAIANTKPGSND